MPHELRRLKLREISSVDRGAGEGVQVLLVKRNTPAEDKLADAYMKRSVSDAAVSSGIAMDDGTFPIADTGDLDNAVLAFGRAADKSSVKDHIMTRARALGAMDRLPAGWALDDALDPAPATVSFSDASKALHASIEAIRSDPKIVDKAKAIDKTFEQFNRSIEGIATAPKAHNKRGQRMAKKADETDDGEDVKAAERRAETAEAALATERAAHAETKKALDRAVSDVAMAKMSDAHREYIDEARLSSEGVGKFLGMSSSQRDDFMKSEPLEKRLSAYELRKRNEQVGERAELQNLRKRDRMATFAKRAADIGMPEAFGETLEKAEGGDKEAFGKMEQALKALTNQANTSRLFAEFGKNNGDGSTASAQMMAKADELRKSEPKLSQQQAFAKVFTDPANADLAKRYRHEEERSAKSAA